MSQLLIATALIFPAFPGGAMPGQDGVSWKDLLIQEAPKAWESYKARAKRLQGTWSYTMRSSFTKKEIDKERCEIKQRDGSTLVLAQTEKTGYLKVVNPKYAFELQRPNEDGRWAVVGVGKNVFRSSPLDDPNDIVRKVNRCPYTFKVVLTTLEVRRH